MVIFDHKITRLYLDLNDLNQTVSIWEMSVSIWKMSLR